MKLYYVEVIKKEETEKDPRCDGYLRESDIRGPFSHKEIHKYVDQLRVEDLKQAKIHEVETEAISGEKFIATPF